MPEYKFNIGGKNITMNPPEGTTREQALGRATNLYVKKHGPIKQESIRDSVKKEMEGSNLWDQFWGGVGNFGIETGQAIRQLMGGDVSEDEIQAARGLTDTPTGMAGNVAGNVAALAVPLGGAEKALKARTLALPKTAGAIGRAAVPVGVGAVEGAVTQPVAEGETRTKNAIIGGVAGGGGEVLSRTLSRGAEGVAKKSELGQELFDKGYSPTVGQASEGVVGNVLSTGENILSAVGVTGMGQNRVGKEMVEKLAGEVDGVLGKYGAAIGELPGRKGDYFEKGAKAFDDAYGELLNSRTIKVPGLMKSNALKSSNDAFKFASPSMRKNFADDINTIFPKHTGRMSGRTYKDIRNKLNQRIRRYTASQTDESKELVDAYTAARKHLDVQGKAGMPPEVWGDLKELDDAYGKFNTFGEAATARNAGVGAASAGDRTLTAKDIIDATEKGTPGHLKMQAAGRMMDDTEPVRELLAEQANKGALARKGAYGLAGMGLGYGSPAGAAALIPGGIGLAGMSKPGARVLMGETAKQKATAEALRKYVAPYAGTAGALTDIEED